MFALYLMYLSTKHIFFFFNDTATTEIYTLSLHDALPICLWSLSELWDQSLPHRTSVISRLHSAFTRSEEHTSELQSRSDLVCRLLLEKKKKTYSTTSHRNTLKQSYSACTDQSS